MAASYRNFNTEIKLKTGTMFNLILFKQIDLIFKNINQKKIKKIVINCNKLEYIDSASLGSLVKCYNEANLNNIEIKLCGLSKKLLDFFESTKLDRFLIIND